MTSTGYGQLGYVRPAPGLEHNGSDAALAVCIDGSAETAYRAGKEIGHLGILQSTFYFKTVDGSLKIWWQKSRTVSSC